MASGKSCSQENPNGIRRIVNGKTIAPRSKRKNERIVETVKRWFKHDNKWTQQDVNVEKFVSKVYIE